LNKHFRLFRDWAAAACVSEAEESGLDFVVACRGFLHGGDELTGHGSCCNHGVGCCLERSV
jgi:hypothetical protein